MNDTTSPAWAHRWQQYTCSWCRRHPLSAYMMGVTTHSLCLTSHPCLELIAPRTAWQPAWGWPTALQGLSHAQAMPSHAATREVSGNLAPPVVMPCKTAAAKHLAATHLYTITYTHSHACGGIDTVHSPGNVVRSLARYGANLRVASQTSHV